MANPISWMKAMFPAIIFGSTTYPNRGSIKVAGAGVSSVTDDEPNDTLTITFAAGGGGSVPTGTGFPHITAGAQDAAAVHGTAGQVIVSTGTDAPFVTLTGPVSVSGAGVTSITGMPVSGLASSTAGYMLVAGGTGVWASVALSGDGTLSSAGALAIGSMSSAGVNIATASTSGLAITSGKYLGVGLGASNAVAGDMRSSSAFVWNVRHSSGTVDANLLTVGSNNITFGDPTYIGNVVVAAGSIYSKATNLIVYNTVGAYGRTMSPAATFTDDFAATVTSVVTQFNGATATALAPTSLSVAVPQTGLSTAWGSVNADGTQAMADADQTPAAAVYQCHSIITTGALTAPRNLTLPTATDAQGYEKTIDNQCTGAFGIIVKCAAGTTITVANGKIAKVKINSTGVRRVSADV